jgi:hypothetical protein
MSVRAVVCAVAMTLPAWGACRAIPGTAELLARPGLRYVLVGEIHGTAETPAIFGDLVCAAVESGRQVVVGLERPLAEQSAIDSGDWTGLLASHGWHIFDGRSSVAMLELVKSLHGMKGAEVVAFDPGGGNEERNAGMAKELRAAAERNPGALVIVLTGNLHASKKAIARFGDYPFMAMLLPGDATVSLYAADRGGTAWTNSGSECGAHPMKSSGGEDRGVAFRKAPMAGYDGVLSTGAVSTASGPAAGGSGCGQ